MFSFGNFGSCASAEVGTLEACLRTLVSAGRRNGARSWISFSPIAESASSTWSLCTVTTVSREACDNW